MPRAYTALPSSIMGSTGNAQTQFYNEGSFVARTMYPNSFHFSIEWGTSTTGTTVLGTFYYPNGMDELDYGKGLFYFGTAGTLRLRINKEGYNFNKIYLNDDAQQINKAFSPSNAIERGDLLRFFFIDRFLLESNILDIRLPNIIGTVGETVLWIGTKGETYYDSAYTQLACGYIGTRSISDSVTIVDADYKTSKIPISDDFGVWDNINYKPRKFRDLVFARDTFELFSIKHQAATSWIFNPEYRVLIDLNNTGMYATTNWHNRIENYSSIDKAQKHWSGKYETSEWSPTFIDENNELLGSMYQEGYDVRDKTIMLRAKTTDTILTWNTQFTGKIKSTKWQNGKLNLTVNDELRNLVNRKFAFDYTCLGTVIDGIQYGIVKQVQGTYVYFDDKGQKSTIRRKSKIRPNYFNVAFNTVLGVVNGIAGNYPGMVINAGAVGVELSKSGEKLDSAYIQIQDDNLIADDTILGQTGVKFYPNAINGNAKNSNSQLYPLLEYNIVGGTFCYGLYATVNIEDTTGINVGDYIYIRKPLIYSGDPDTIIKNILTGSNIDYPYTRDVPNGENLGYYYNDGVLVAPKPSDFNNNWNSELSAYDSLSLYKQIEFTSNPFDEIKELIETCQLYFYIDGDNKFAVSSIDGKDILRQNNGLATYSDVFSNILKEFSYSKSTEDAYGKLIYKYGYNSNNEFSRKKEFVNKYSQFEAIPKTIESKWVQNDDDAYVLGYRAFQKYGTGYETISIPTTLYGLLNNVGDLIRVNHRTGSIVNKTFEIVAQEKDLDNNQITFEAENVEYINNQGLCEWGASFSALTINSKSGWSNIGILTSLGTSPSIGNLGGSYNSYTTVISGLGLGVLENHYFVIGSSNFGNIEICACVNTYITSALIIRGLFNTISKPFGPLDKLYDIGPIKLKSGYTEISREALLPNSLSHILFATTYEINPLIGTSFKFF